MSGNKINREPIESSTVEVDRPDFEETVLNAIKVVYPDTAILSFHRVAANFPSVSFFMPDQKKGIVIELIEAKDFSFKLSIFKGNDKQMHVHIERL